MSDEKVFHLVYVSAATHPLDKADLLQMLKEARERNQQLGVTGLLLYKDGDFIQLLEGDKATVKALFQDSIRKDPRHRNIQVLIEDEAPKRLFADWSMGFRNLADPVVQMTPGFSQFMNTPLRRTNLQQDACGHLGLLTLTAGMP